MTPAKPLAVFFMVDSATVHPNPGNPRTDLGPLDDLADSIAAQGIIQPLIVTHHPTVAGHYQLLAGHRRLAAAELAGKTRVPVVLRTGKTAAEALAMALVENGQRQDLDPLQEAQALRDLIDGEGIDQKEAARRIGRSQTFVCARLSLLTLTPSQRQQLQTGALSVAAAEQTARARRGTAGTRPSLTPWFGRLHPLAPEARDLCAGEHPRSPRLSGGQACGRCWEQVLRADAAKAARGDGP